jgi:hypothetical protein
LDVLRIEVGPWTDDDGQEQQNVILVSEMISQAAYRSADREGDAAPFQLRV